MPTKFILTKEEFEKNSEDKDQAVIFVGKIENSFDFDLYLEVAKKFPHMNFMHTTNLKKYLNITEETDNMVMVFNYFSNETHIFKQDSWTSNDL